MWARRLAGHPVVARPPLASRSVPRASALSSPSRSASVGEDHVRAGSDGAEVRRSAQGHRARTEPRISPPWDRPWLRRAAAASADAARRRGSSRSGSFHGVFDHVAEFFGPRFVSFEPVCKRLGGEHAAVEIGGEAIAGVRASPQPGRSTDSLAAVALRDRPLRPPSAPPVAERFPGTGEDVGPAEALDRPFGARPVLSLLLGPSPANGVKVWTGSASSSLGLR